MSNDRLTEQQIQAMTERCEKATAGPWQWRGDHCLESVGSACDDILMADDDKRPYGMHSALIAHHYDEATAQANRDFIAHARTDLPACLREIGRLTKECDELAHTVHGKYGIKHLTAQILDHAAEQAKWQLEKLTLTQKLAELTDLLDLAHDEFRRIAACCSNLDCVSGDESLQEIRGLCERGQTKIRQNVPVIVQRDRLEQKLAELERENSIRSRQQAYGPHRPTIPQLIAAIQMLPAHVEVQSVSINGQTGMLIVETRHDDGDQVYAFQEEHKGGSEYRWEPTTEERPQSTPTERPENE